MYYYKILTDSRVQLEFSIVTLGFALKTSRLIK